MKNLFCLGFLIFSYGLNAAPDESQAQAFDEYHSSIQKSWNELEDQQTKASEVYKSAVEKSWSDVALSSQKIYVDYFDDFKSRVKIDFDEGVVKVEVLDALKRSKSSIEALFIKGLERNRELLDGQLSTDSAILKQIKSSIQDINGKTLTKYELGLKMVPEHVKIRAKKYLPSVIHWSSKNSIPPQLVLAVMWQESAFNPKARSHIPAFGLMQIVPKYAGNEVKEYLGESDIVDGDFLYKADNNIRYGTSYLKLLSQKYFSHILPFEKRAPFIIAGYNWGPSRLLKHLERGSIKVLSSSEIKQQIIAVAPAETKGYLVKVLENWKRIDSDKWLTNL